MRKHPFHDTLIVACIAGAIMGIILAIANDKAAESTCMVQDDYGVTRPCEQRRPQ
jgi:hypothetical protein